MLQPEREAMDRERLRPLVLERMRATLARVRANPAYAARLDGAAPVISRAPTTGRGCPS